MRRTVLVGAVAIVVGLGIGGFLWVRGAGESPTPQAESAPVTEAVLGLCAAAETAAEGDVEGAREAFFARSHVGLHTLAPQVAERDRASAARVLEAKQVVESMLREGASSTGLEADLRELLERTREAARAVDADPPLCPDEGG